MKTPVLILLGFALLAGSMSHAQSGWPKIFQGSKKKGDLKKEGKTLLTPANMASADSARIFLEKKEISKDSRGISGIYYANKPVLVSKLQGAGTTWIKKFLIHYIEGPYRNDILLNSQFAYENAEAGNVVKQARFWMNDGEKKIEKATGFIATWQDDPAANANYQFYTQPESGDPAGKNTSEKDLPENFTGALIEAEPGVFLVGNILPEDTKAANLERNKKTKALLVLIRADKLPTAAVTYSSNAAAWNKLAEVFKKYENASTVQSTHANTLPAPKSGFRNAPSEEALKKAAQAFLNKHQSSAKLEYIYTSSEWSKVYKPLGPLLQNTLVGRELKAVLVASKNDECLVHFVTLRQDNSFVTGTLTENFENNTMYIPAFTAVNNVDCGKARQYKK